MPLIPIQYGDTGTVVKNKINSIIDSFNELNVPDITITVGFGVEFDINVNDFANHAEAITEAINQASTNKYRIELQKATYNINTTLTLFRECFVFGNGATLNWTGANGGAIIDIQNLDYVVIEYLKLTQTNPCTGIKAGDNRAGNGASNHNKFVGLNCVNLDVGFDGGDNVLGFPCYDSLFINSTFNNCITGVLIGELQNIFIGCYFRNCTVGFKLKDVRGGGANNLNANNCVFSLNDTHILIDGNSQGINANNCWFERATNEILRDNNITQKVVHNLNFVSCKLSCVTATEPTSTLTNITNSGGNLNFIACDIQDTNPSITLNTNADMVVSFNNTKFIEGTGTTAYINNGQFVYNNINGNANINPNVSSTTILNLTGNSVVTLNDGLINYQNARLVLVQNNVGGYTVTINSIDTTFFPTINLNPNGVTTIPLIWINGNWEIANSFGGTGGGSQDLSGLVPYTGATTNVDLGVNNITANKVKLNTTPTLGTLANGDIYWDVNNHTASLVLDSVNGVVGQLMQEQHVYVRNNSGATIPNGSIVYQTGVIGGHPTVGLAIATSENTTYPLAVATQDIPNNSNGYCTTNGMVRGLNTNSYTENDELFLSATTAGQFIATPPTSPNYVVKVGSVTVKNPANGEILVDIHNPISNNNALGTSQKLGATQNAIKTYVDTEVATKQNTLVSGSNIKTINGDSILGSGDIQDNGEQLAYFGSGIDGDVTISGSTVVTLTRPMYYNNLTITGNAQILTAGFPVYIAGTLDISGATNPTGAFNFAGNNGSAGNVNGTAGTQPAVQNNAFFGAGARGGIGGAGSTGAGGQGGSGVAGLAGVSANDCGSGASKGGGAGSGGSGGPGRGSQTSSFRTPLHLTTTWMFGATLITGGCSGGGGGAGGGNGTNSGPGGGSGGNGGGIVAVFARTINRSSSTVAGVFNASGGNGGAGTTTNQNNCGGSSGGGGGGGGAILIIYSNLTGTTTANAFNVNGGNGATGGSGLGTGIGASGTDGGNAGIVVLFNLASGTMTLHQQTVAPTTGVLVSSGNAGGAGGTGGQVIANF